MNIDKTINELSNRLDLVHPYSSSFTSNKELKNDGINYWKGKKIISVKDWNELYEKNSTYTRTYKITLTSRKPLLYFPDNYNDSISSIGVVSDELKEEIQKWNADYSELLEYRKNPILGRKKCSKCLLSSSHDDPIFAGIEKVFAKIVMKYCNSNDTVNDYSQSPNITYHCNVMNIFSCPFKSKESFKNIDEKDETSKLSYKREDLFALHKISFAFEQAITTFFETTRNNEIIFEVDFENDRVKEIHTSYYGESKSWGWQENVNEQLSKVKPISNIVIRDEQDIYNILTNREKLEYLLQEYEKNQLDKGEEEGQEICRDENTPCVPNDDNYNPYNKKATPSIDIMPTPTMTIDSVVTVGQKQHQQIPQELQKLKEEDISSHKGENCHSNKKEEELDNEKLTSNLKSRIKDELEEQEKEQQILLKENKQNIIAFLLDNKDSIKVEDLKIYEPIYKCYREKGNCIICNSSSNIICKNCNYSYHSHYNNKEVMLCINHWKQHAIENHLKQLIK